MNLLRLMVFSAFAVTLASCTSAGVKAEGAPAPGGDAKEKSDKEGELRKHQRELEYAKLQLEISRIDAKNGERALAEQLVAAERELATATAELDNFTRVAREIETAELALSLDRSKQNTLEAEQELSELETMYKQEEFAGMTKELVLNRGRTRLAMAKRDLDLTQRRAEQVRGFEHPKKERDLAERVTKAQQGLEKANSEAAKSRVETKLSLLKAEHAVDDAERALAKLSAG